jgi:hypothetical protein
VVVGGAASHFNMGLNGVIRVQGKTVSLSGTPAFSTAFAQGSTGGMAVLVGSTFSGAAAGKRYEVSVNAALYTAQGDTFLPGDVAGTTATGGQYA